MSPASLSESSSDAEGVSLLLLCLGTGVYLNLGFYYSLCSDLSPRSVTVLSSDKDRSSKTEGLLNLWDPSEVGPVQLLASRAHDVALLQRFMLMCAQQDMTSPSPICPGDDVGGLLGLPSARPAKM